MVHIHGPVSYHAYTAIRLNVRLHVVLKTSDPDYQGLCLLVSLLVIFSFWECSWYQCLRGGERISLISSLFNRTLTWNFLWVLYLLHNFQCILKFLSLLQIKIGNRRCWTEWRTLDLTQSLRISWYGSDVLTNPQERKLNRSHMLYTFSHSSPYLFSVSNDRNKLLPYNKLQCCSFSIF